MRHLKLSSVKDLYRFGDAKQVKKALMEAIDTAPLNYFIVYMIAGLLSLYISHLDSPTYRYRGT